MPKPPVLAVVHNINGDISNAIDSITHRLLRNPNGYTAEQILNEMGPKAAAFVQHFMSGHSYLGTPPPALPTLPGAGASGPATSNSPASAPQPSPVAASQPAVAATPTAAQPAVPPAPAAVPSTPSTTPQTATPVAIAQAAPVPAAPAK